MEEGFGSKCVLFIMNKTVLLIEKDNRLKEFWTDVLQDEGFSVVSAGPAEVVDIIPDFVFLGTGIGEKDAKDTLTDMKRINENILVISPANPGELIKELDAIQAQGLSYKEHPIRIDQVRFAIKDAIMVQEMKERYNFKNLIGASPRIKEVFKAMSQVIQSHATSVLILGGTGTGKEEVAKAIHYNSDRAEKPFMAVSCTAVPETLMESELFGHEAGAFTDAKSTKKGLLELANGGTVFLDEIGDMKMGLQAKLLRFLEEKKFHRVGGTQDISVDVRIIAATNKDLEKLVREGDFREDLYYRLKVFPIHIPPLRDRKEDIVLLAKHFIEQFNKELKKEIKGLTFSANERLTDYTWPGNVRELKNVIERAMILCNGDYISPAELVLEVEGGQTSRTFSLEENEKRLIKAALDKTGGNQSKAAELLGITRFALRNRMKKYNI